MKQEWGKNPYLFTFCVNLFQDKTSFPLQGGKQGGNPLNL
ncbi:hypothetical protein ES705_13385 [subsurface metagenome]